MTQQVDNQRVASLFHLALIKICATLELDTRIAKTEQYKEYKFMLWYIPKPFESIINGIIELSQLVDKTLK